MLVCPRMLLTVSIGTPFDGGSIARTWNDKYYLEPIPGNQLTLDPNLGQNPGW